MLRQAEAAAQRVSHRDAPVRRSMIRRERPGEPSVLGRMLRGGRGGDVRLRLFLSLLWISVKSPHATEFPARGWAELFGLEDPDAGGAKRVTEGMNWLVEQRLLRAAKQPGRPSKIWIMNEDGKGGLYTLPGKSRHAYFKVPVAFWLNGWIAVLSGRAIALLLILIDWHSSHATDDFWISPSRSRDLYDISPDTWTSGLQELKSQGLVSVRRVPVNESAFGWRRLRNRYLLNWVALDQKPK